MGLITQELTATRLIREIEHSNDTRKKDCAYKGTDVDIEEACIPNKCDYATLYHTCKYIDPKKMSL